MWRLAVAADTTEQTDNPAGVLEGTRKVGLRTAPGVCVLARLERILVCVPSEYALLSF